MFGKLLFLFIAVPLFEIAILVKLGTLIGFWPTLLLQIATGFLGALLARLQGVLTWRKIALQLHAGRFPTDEMISGLLIFAAGIVLMTPGLLTDLGGFLLLVPWTRNRFKAWLRKQWRLRFDLQEPEDFGIV